MHHTTRTVPGMGFVYGGSANTVPSNLMFTTPSLRVKSSSTVLATMRFCLDCVCIVTFAQKSQKEELHALDITSVILSLEQ